MKGLELRGISKHFGPVVAVDRLNLTVGRGELVALLGPSGCGKTTTLRMVAGFERPDQGQVLIDGDDVTDLPPERRGVGIVFQNFALFPHMTVAENIGYGLALRGMRPADRRRRAEELLALVGLAGLGDRRPEALSAGQQQRVALARSLAPEPRVLLLDEPLSALDAPVRRHLRAEIRRVQRELGITTLYVTHDQEEALATADRIAVLREGHLEQVDTPEGIYRRPRTPFVASFVGEGNLWEARVEDEPLYGGSLQVRVGRQRWQVPVPLRDGAPGSPSASALPLPGPGSVVHLVVRPEQIRVLGQRPASAPAGAGLNLFEARLVDAEYLGHSVLLQAAFDGGQVRALMPGHRAGLLGRQPGETLLLAFEAGAAWVVPGDGGPPEPGSL